MSSLKCKSHKYNEYEFVYLKPKAKDILLCSSCVDESNGAIKISDCVGFKQILQADSKTVLQKFPPLISSNLSQLAFYLSSSIDAEIKEIKEFYCNLVKDYELAIKKAISKSKTQIDRLTQLQSGFIEQYQQIAQIEQLKQLLILRMKDQNAESKLRSFLDGKVSEQSQNSNILTAQMKELQQLRESYSTEQPEILAKKILTSLDEITFFNLQVIPQANLSKGKSIINEITIVPSRNVDGSTDNIAIDKINNQILINFPRYKGQSCFETALNPNKRYIITLKNTIGNKSLPCPRFYFGIMPFTLRHDKLVEDYEFCYRESISLKGISRMLKGDKLHLGENYSEDMNNFWRLNDHRRFEVRIFLKEKLVKVGALPNYDLVAELSHKDLINLSEQYTFVINNIGLNNRILIEDVVEVDVFDDLM